MYRDDHMRCDKQLIDAESWELWAFHCALTGLSDVHNVGKKEGKFTVNAIWIFGDRIW